MCIYRARLLVALKVGTSPCPLICSFFITHIHAHLCFVILVSFLFVISWQQLYINIESTKVEDNKAACTYTSSPAHWTTNLSIILSLKDSISSLAGTLRQRWRRDFMMDEKVSLLASVVASFFRASSLSSSRNVIILSYKPKWTINSQEEKRRESK